MKSIKKKIIAWIIGVILIVIAIGIIRFFDYCRHNEITPKQYFEILEISYKEKSGLEYEKVYLPSSIIPSIDGAAYVSPIVNGDTIKIEGNIYNAVITPDKSKIVAVEKDGNLFITDLALSYRESIAKKADCLIAVTNEGVIYKDTKNVFHRYLFEDASNLSLGKVTDYVVSEQGLNIAFADRWGKVYILKAESGEKEKVGTYSESVELLALSNDGNRLSYENYKSDGSTERCVIGEAEVLEGVSDGYYEYYGDYVYDIGKGVLYLVDKETGDREQVISNIIDCEIIDNKIYYVSALETLYSATLSKSDIIGIKEIDSNVREVIEVVKSGKRLYYAKQDEKNESSEMITLWAYGFGDDGDEAIQISSPARMIIPFNINSDDTIYYFLSDTNSVDGWYMGDFMKYTWGDTQEVRIAEDVDFTSVADDLWLGKGEDNILDVESFIFKQIVIEYIIIEHPGGIDGEILDQYTINWIYCDGVENKVFLEEKVLAEPYVGRGYTIFPQEYLLDGTKSGQMLTIKKQTE